MRSLLKWNQVALNGQVDSIAKESHTLNTFLHGELFPPFATVYYY
jgi:hypothetical protein